MSDIAVFGSSALKTNVLVMSVGPVQAFIAAARRGKDLCYASWLLSELARAAASVAGKRLVMPYPGDLRPSGVSNKITALCDSDPAGLAAEMEEAARARLDGIVDDLLGLQGLDVLVDSEMARDQVRDLPEFAWASAQVCSDRPYNQARALAERLLAARKSMRTFSQPSWSGPIMKSSLDGQRESVLRADSGRYRSESDKQALHRFGIGPSERLCGVGLLKRLGSKCVEGLRAIPSTSHIASWSTRAAIADLPREQARASFMVFERELLALGADLSRAPDDPVLGRRDGHLLYETRMADHFPDGSPQVPCAEDALKRLFRAWSDLSDSPIRRPNPYYAVLRADGDKMGEKLHTMPRPEDHRGMTKALSEFSLCAPQIVEKFHGHCVYAGGDDVLALVPVGDVLRCARELSERFAEVGSRFTLSVGVHIAHHIAPLQDALTGSMKAEAHAKLRRDSWAIQIDKRGGAPVLIGGKWQELQGVIDLQELMQGPDGLPRGLPYALEQIAERLPGDELAKVRLAEASRVLAQRGVDPNSLHLKMGLRVVADWLLVARTLSGLEADHGR